MVRGSYAGTWGVTVAGCCATSTSSSAVDGRTRRAYAREPFPRKSLESDPDAHRGAGMRWARVVSVPLLEARNLPADEWYPVPDLPEAPPHYVYVLLHDKPHLIWAGHLEVRYGRPEG